eukprot:TRINITY_DN981_c1_g1_i1.p2 TRINITY_DN981_c1_g1~~TRINITY_DN981_c1_g1_i1.p2  ORF type:complete len:105 (+),score=2.17 TRINITY_DN981_c1_g1_i1:257-571(+)
MLINPTQNQLQISSLYLVIKLTIQKCIINCFSKFNLKMHHKNRNGGQPRRPLGKPGRDGSLGRLPILFYMFCIISSASLSVISCVGGASQNSKTGAGKRRQLME